MQGPAALLLTVLALPDPAPAPTPAPTSRPAVAPVQSHLERGELLLGKKQYERAEAELRKAVDQDPGSSRAHGNLALALLAEGRIPAAVNEGRLAAAFGPDLPEARYIYGLTLNASGRPAEAAREFEKALALKPGQARLLRVLARAYAVAEDARAVETYTALIALEPEQPAHRSELADYLWRRNKVDEGNRIMDEALLHLPGDPALTREYGRALFEQGRYFDAIERLERTRALGSSEATTILLLGNAYWQADNTRKAREILETASRTGPPNSRLEGDLGRLLLSLGETEAALPHLEEAARGRPDAAEVRLDLGRACETLGRLDDAEQAYRRAVQLSPNSPRAHYALGRLLLRRGQKQEAERQLAIHRQLYDRARQLVSEAQARSGESALAWAELIQGRSTEALARFAALPESADSLLGRATALSHLSRHREAALALERGLELEPENRRIERLLAVERSRVEEK